MLKQRFSPNEEAVSDNLTCLRCCSFTKRSKIVDMFVHVWAPLHTVVTESIPPAVLKIGSRDPCVRTSWIVVNLSKNCFPE